MSYICSNPLNFPDAMKEKILKMLLVLLGFGAAACEEKNIDAYGCPAVDFSLKAKVTDNIGRPIKGIKVRTVNYAYYYYGAEYEFDSNGEGYTDSDGNAELKAKIATFDSPPYYVNVGFEDVDGAENGGEFAMKQVEIKVTESDRSMSSTWIKAYSVDLGDVALDGNGETEK